jgi:hypothetical protein
VLSGLGNLGRDRKIVTSVTALFVRFSVNKGGEFVKAAKRRAEGLGNEF